MKNYIAFVLAASLVSGIVMIPSYADTTPMSKLDLTKNLKVPPPNPYSHDHKTNVHFDAKTPLKTDTGAQNSQDLKKAQGNYVAGQPWGSSAVTASQATQAQQAQNSHQAQNVHQATQATQANENQPSHKNTNSLQPLQKNNKPVVKLP